MSDIIVTKSNGTTDITYKRQSVQGNEVIYLNEASGLTAPENLRVKHQLRPSGAKGTDRHNVTFSKSVVETTTLNFLVLSASLQLNVPRSSDITTAMVKDLIAQMVSYLLPSANLTSFVAGGFPEGDYNVTGPFNPTMA